MAHSPGKPAFRGFAWAVLALVSGGLLVSNPAEAQSQNAQIAQLTARLAALEARTQKLDDQSAIEKLTRAYGYYVDKQLWNEIVPLFSDDARVEIAGRGVYRGSAGVDRLFRLSMGRGNIGLSKGGLFNHMILQGIVNVSDDGKTATGRWRAFVQIGQAKAFAMWSEGTYENKYVKRNGVWQISDMHFYATYYTPFDQGWAKQTMPNNGPTATAGPDEPQSVQYDVFPGHYVPPFSYPNPVSGRAWTMEDTLKYSTKGEGPAAAGPPVQPGGPIQPGSPAPATPAAPPAR